MLLKVAGQNTVRCGASCPHALSTAGGLRRPSALPRPCRSDLARPCAGVLRREPAVFLGDSPAAVTGRAVCRFPVSVHFLVADPLRPAVCRPGGTAPADVVTLENAVEVLLFATGPAVRCLLANGG